MFEDGNLSTYLSISGKLTLLKDLTMFVKLAFSLEQVSEIKMILFHLESGDVSMVFPVYKVIVNSANHHIYPRDGEKTRWDLTEYKRRQLRVEKIEADYEWQPGKFLIIFLR